MLDTIKNHAWDLWSLIAGALGGCTIGSFVTFRLYKGQNVNGNGRIVNQTRARAGGDIIGGNKTSDRRK